VASYAAAGQNGPDITVPDGLVINDIACPAPRICYTAGAAGTIEALYEG
jgi:hypothetical protein